MKRESEDGIAGRKGYIDRANCVIWAGDISRPKKILIQACLPQMQGLVRAQQMSSIMIPDHENLLDCQWNPSLIRNPYTHICAPIKSQRAMIDLVTV